MGKKRPFKFFNFLTDHPDFLDTVAASWNSTEQIFHSTSALFKFHKKLKYLKPLLRRLNQNRFGNIPKRTQDAFDKLCEKQKSALQDPTETSFTEAADAMNDWNHWASIEESFLRQKSRITWLQQGDQNSLFFFKIVQSRTSYNMIRQLTLPSGEVITDLHKIKGIAASHFENFLNQSPQTAALTDSAQLTDLLDFRCPNHTAQLLTHPISEAEIRNVLFSMPSSKAPGPDGFPADFYRASWDIIKKDFIIAVHFFFMFGFLPRGVNATILTLIPKHGDAREIKDYRPISCCNILYKVISKILANRLKVLLPELIEPNQCAFVKGRLLLENVLLATELVKNYHKESIQPRSVLKLDISKAFDSVNWIFITSTLRALGIPEMFIHWIHTCLSTATFSVYVNGELEGFFGSECGLRQGCALSPYLFVIAVNVLSRMLNKGALSQQFGFHPHCRKVNLTHLSFADDLMIFTDGAVESLKGIFEILTEFEGLSGLVINPAKSSIFMAGRISQEFKDEAHRHGIPTDSLPVRYLGLPLTTKTMTKADYEPLIDQIRTRMVSWSSRCLSYAGRLQLVKTVIGNITNFWCSVFRLPKTCLNTIEGMCAAFLWSGSPNTHTKAKVAWEDICRPTDEGGLGIRRLTDTSRVFALSLIWRLLTNSGSLWVAWTKAYLLKTHSFWDTNGNNHAGSWIWRKLLKLRDQAAPFMKSEIGNGKGTLFWYDNWLPVGRLIDIAGALGTQVLGIPRYATVSDAASGGQWNIRRCRGYHLRAMIACINSVPAPAEDADEDRTLWRHGDGEYKEKFSSTATWEQLRGSNSKLQWCKVVWFRQSIPRFSFITWLAFKDRLATGARTRAWGIVQPCLLCGEPDETRDHLFFACPFSFTVWLDLVGFILGPNANPDWTITINSITSNRRKETDRCLLKLALQASIHSIWRERNSRRHNNNPTSTGQMVHYIDKTIRNRLSSLRQRNPTFYAETMQRWFERTS
ncbi:uncharacterized protein LOC125589247 [Brassica napus]|uniref:uncharacterized protein LOC125589247 n=1 Tax=Brassica napus TaxID=3708 RepID=UPI00207A7FD0|nr:uncharacterized protein LOC125589247 [Brassica napus]XP_048617727.1 uncharacterized protein LOC125589247 [Brassica napus]